jgi:hypothetical protein
MSEDVFFGALTLVCGTIVVIASMFFYRRVVELRNERRIPLAVDELKERLRRIELAVDSTALEVERISEANRFMAKLLADRRGAVHLVGKPEPVITPH